MTITDSIAEDSPTRCIVLMRQSGVEYFNLDSPPGWSFDKATYYRDLDNEGCHWYLLDFRNINDESRELTPSEAVKMVMDAYKKEREA